MAVFAISFRIASDSSYSDRYQSVVDAILKISPGIYWDETTSFVIVEAEKSSENMASEIDNGSTFRPSTDLLVVINLSQKGYAVRGQYSDKDLDKLMEKR